jgi:hypothetical protein
MVELPFLQTLPGSFQLVPLIVGDAAPQDVAHVLRQSWAGLETLIVVSSDSFVLACQWVRDPLLTLGCQDPAERVSEAKERDGQRQFVASLFAVWWGRNARLA